MIYPKNRQNQTCDYWLIKPNKQILCVETDSSKQREITNRRAGTYEIAPLTVQCRLQSIVLLIN